MKKIFAPILGFAALLSMASCSEDFEVAAPYKNITVGYGLINMVDTAHYIRIQKAFLDENKSALDMAKEDDSSFFNNLEVRMKEIDPSVPATSANSIKSNVLLDKVDLRNEGYPKNPGTFFQDKNWAYKYKHTLSPNYRYRLVINNKTTGEIDSAETEVLASDSVSFTTTNFGEAAFRMQFASASPTSKSFELRGLRTPETFAILEGMLRVNWVDKTVATGAQKDTFAYLQFYSGGPDGNAVPNKIVIGYQDLQSRLYNAMGPAPDGVERYMDSVDFYLWAGTGVFANYLQYSLSQGGLTGDQIKPVYTNFSGANVRGLFTSRAMVKKLNIEIDQISIDSLKFSKITEKLNVRGRSDH